jgi:peptidoglycan/xylan/chitin deacetylase (PgdA/CDA1 family)
MIRAASRALLRGAIRQVGRVPVTRRALHALSVAARGAGVAFLRARRIVPDDERGRAHPDRALGAGMTATELDRELATIQKTLRFVHLREAIEHLSAGTRLEDGLAVLTFDESLKSTAELALPVCRARGVPFTIFVTTSHLEDRLTLWDEAVRASVEAAAPNPLAVPWIDRVLKTDTPKARASAVHRLLLSLASLDEERLARRLEELFARVGGRPSVDPLDRMLSSQDVTRLAAEPLVSFGAHGHTHVALATCSEATLVHELALPREQLRALAPSSFTDVVSYPFGRAPYVDERVVQAARAAGYFAGLGADPGVARPGDHLFRLPRLPIGPKTSGLAAYELAGTLAAVDEIVLAASGERERVDAALQG